MSIALILTPPALDIALILTPPALDIALILNPPPRHHLTTSPPDNAPILCKTN